MKKNEIQKEIENFMVNVATPMTAQEITIAMGSRFTFVNTRYHLDNLVMKGVIKSITDSQKGKDGRNHKVIKYWK